MDTSCIHLGEQNTESVNNVAAKPVKNINVQIVENGFARVHTVDIANVRF
jgi:hypothetical protein